MATIRIKRFNKELPLPEYKTSGAVAFDMAARERREIMPGTVEYVPLNVAIEIPEGYFIMLAPRSSTHKKGLMLANSIGIFDLDYCGDNDEYIAAYLNFSKEPVVIEAGERVAQALLVKIERAEWEEVHAMDKGDRGGFGTTGKF